MKYDSYGNVTAGDTSLSRYLFTSRELDTETGLQYNRARWYDAQTGRWINEDPLGFAAGDGNVTRYVGNGVTESTDPAGTSKLSRLWHWFFDDSARTGEVAKDTGGYLIPGPAGEAMSAAEGAPDAAKLLIGGGARNHLIDEMSRPVGDWNQDKIDELRGIHRSVNKIKPR